MLKRHSYSRRTKQRVRAAAVSPRLFGFRVWGSGLEVSVACQGSVPERLETRGGRTSSSFPIETREKLEGAQCRTLQ